MTVPPDDDLVALAEVQGVLIEVLEMRNSELAGQVADLAGRLARLLSRNSGNSGNSSMPPSDPARRRAAGTADEGITGARGGAVTAPSPRGGGQGQPR